MARVENIFLVGARGSGKSHVGKALASLLGSAFVDLDLYLCERENSSVEKIVSACGWPRFRQLESDCLREAVGKCNGPTIFATGGGIVLDRQNRDFMRANGLVIWLDTPPLTLHERLTATPEKAQRPALSNLDPLEEIHKVLEQRTALYRDCCHYRISGEEEASSICQTILGLSGARP